MTKSFAFAAPGTQAVAIVLTALCVLFAGPARAATPSSGTLTDSSGPLTYSAGPFFVANPTPIPAVDSGPRCNDPVQACDNFALTIALSDAYLAAHPNDQVKISIAWKDSGAGVSDYDLYVFKGTVATTDGSQTADYSSASSANPEVVYIPVSVANGTYSVKIVPYTPTGETVNATIELVSGASSGGPPPPPPTGGPGVPRYQIFVPQDGLGQDSQGEFNIGFNPKTGNIMTLADVTTYRVTPPEKLNPPLPEAAPALWTDVTPSIANTTTLDPILITDQATGRTFTANQTTGANILFAFTDDDGANWTQLSASPPNGGADHETIGAGPYPAGSPFAQVAQAAGYPNAVYYCSQGEVPAFCQRSDTGGLSFGPGVPIYNGVTTQCSGIHGHVKVAPDGTVYVPNKACGAQQGGALSTDAGVTWNEFLIPNSAASNGFDPSIGIASDNTAYFCYVNGDGHPHVAVSHDDGKTWGDDFDIGAQQGIQNAVFVEAVAGDPDRAACGFVGTTTAGNWQSLDFTGVWYLYIAHTYDGGKTWTTVNATPNDPVQGMGGICAAGISCSSTPNNRNLLDFDEVTHDDKGYVLFGYDDGCVSDNCIASGGQNNDFVADMRVARQSGGKPLFAANDPAEPTVPKRPYLQGTRTAAGSMLSWNAPDSGGAAITDYQVYRGNASGAETLLADLGSAKTSYEDKTADPTVSDYFYTVKAVNSQGASAASNEIDLKVTTPPPQESPCVIPGVTVATDSAGDETDMLPQHDVLSVQIAEPYDQANPPGDDLVFSLNLSSASLIPPNSIYYVRFNLPDNVQYFVSYDTSTLPAPTFNYGHVSQGAGGVSQDNTDGALDPSSGVDTTNNRIVFVLPKKDIAALANNATLSAVIGESRLLVGAAGTGLIEQLDATGNGTYHQIGNAACAPNRPPLAALTASPTSGTAPLTVSFDASGSSDPDPGDGIASYTFDFNDGSPKQTLSTPTTTHVYQNDTGNPVNYNPSVSVTDHHGAVSQNAAAVVITVAPSSGGGSSSGGSTSGGSTSGGSTSGGSTSGGSTSGGSTSGGSTSGGSSSGGSTSGGSTGGGSTSGGSTSGGSTSGGSTSGGSTSGGSTSGGTSSGGTSSGGTSSGGSSTGGSTSSGGSSSGGIPVGAPGGGCCSSGGAFDFVDLLVLSAFAALPIRRRKVARN